MRVKVTSATLWRCLVVVLAAIGITLLAIELTGASRVLTPNVAAEPLFEGTYLLERGPTTFVVRALPPMSPLRVLGVQPGDHLRYDAPLARWYNVAAGDPVSLTVLRGDTSRRIEVKAVAAPSLPHYTVANYVLDKLTIAIALLMGVIVGWTRSDSTALRAMAATGLLAAINFPYSAPEPSHLLWLDFIGSVCQALGPLGVLVIFALNYPDDRPAGWRAVLKHAFPWFFGVQVIATLVFMARLYTGQMEPLAWPVFRVADAVNPVVFVVALLLARVRAQGELRVRFQWILATLGALVCAVLLHNLNRWTGQPVAPELSLLVVNTTVLVAEVGFVYAVFRHRIFDFGFAVNRALVYGVASAILLLAFFLLEKLAEHYLHLEGREQNALLDGGIALGVFLFFHQVRHVVEHHLERLFFSKWHNNEKALRRFLKQAEHITSSDALIAALTVELDRFTGGAGNATYRPGATGHFERLAGTLQGAAEIVDVNEPLVLALRTDPMPTRREETTSLLSAALALPLTRRAALDGFILVGAKPGRESYRPDEVELLGFAVNRLGLDLHALDAENLKIEVAEYRSTIASLQASGQEMRSLLEVALTRSSRAE